MRKEIENRLILLSVGINKLFLVEPKNQLTHILGDQLVRSSTSAALNYGEAQGAESRKDFIHKTSLVLKELRETGIALKIILQSGAIKQKEEVLQIISECDQLTAIFQKTVTSARSKKR